MMNEEVTKLLFSGEFAKDIDVRKISRNQLMKIDDAQIRYKKLNEHQEIINQIKRAYLPTVLTQNSKFQFSKNADDLTIEEILIELCTSLMENGLKYEDLKEMSSKRRSA